jgi:prophage regulatory protein
MHDRIVRTTEVCQRLGVSQTTLWRWRREGVFPNPKTLKGTSLQGWLESEFTAWLSENLTLVMEANGDEQ